MWKGKKANAQERKGAISQALVGMGSGREWQGEGRRSDCGVEAGVDPLGPQGLL